MNLDIEKLYNEYLNMKKDIISYSTKLSKEVYKRKYSYLYNSSINIFDIIYDYESEEHILKLDEMLELRLKVYRNEIDLESAEKLNNNNLNSKYTDHIIAELNKK